jgi:non-ribosomal peptide synthetase component E (peptide arylation enzyme)
VGERRGEHISSRALGEQVWAFVAIGEGSQVTTVDLFIPCRERLAGYKVPDHICIGAALPLTHVGMQRFLLVEEALAGRRRPVSRRTS